MTINKKSLFIGLLLLLSTSFIFAEPVQVTIPLLASWSGNSLYVRVIVAKYGDADFMLDTGASGILMPHPVMDELVKAGKATKTGEDEARIADGTIVKIDIYKVSEVNINAQCTIKDVEISSIRGADEASFLLGTRVLKEVDPITISIDNAVLIINCENPTTPETYKAED